MRNAQGDVVQIRNSQNEAVANYCYDAWGKLLSITDANGNKQSLTNDTFSFDNTSIAYINPIRYRGYVYDNETGFYYLNTRYYDPSLRRFISADDTDNLGADGSILSHNLFAYCLNNPVMNYDPYGLWTIGFSLGINVTIFAGVSINIGFVIDDNWNFDWQWSYALPGVDNTNAFGVISAGVGAAVQITNRDTVYDLYGPATYVGASVGDGLYVGGDVISFSDASDPNSTIDGIQLTGGVGIGLDTHIIESNTKPVGKQNEKLNNASTDQNKDRRSASRRRSPRKRSPRRRGRRGR